MNLGQAYGPEALNKVFGSIEPVSDLLVNEARIHAVILGMPKAGKTTLAAQFAADGPVLFLDVNYGTVSIAGYKDCYYMRIYPDGVMNSKGEWVFYEHQDWEQQDIQKRKEKIGTKLLQDVLVKAIQSKMFKTIVLDDETGLFRLMQNCIPVPTSFKYKKYVLDTRGWFNEILNYRNKILTILDTHPGHAIWNCHTRPAYDSSGNVVGYEPWIVGQSITLVPASMDEVWFLERQGSNVTLYTEREDFPRLGSRYHLPAKIPNASFLLIKQLLQANRERLQKEISPQQGGQDEVVKQEVTKKPDFDMANFKL